MKDLAVGETITVGGVPAEILADSLEIVPASPATPGAAAAPGAGAAPGVPAGQGFPGRDRPQVRAMVTGTVAGVNPLVVTGPDGAKVTIITNEQTKVSRRKQIGVQELVEGEHFAAFGQPDARDVVQARTAVTGASQEDVQTLMREVGRDAMGFRAPAVVRAAALAAASWRCPGGSWRGPGSNPLTCPGRAGRREPGPSGLLRPSGKPRPPSPATHHPAAARSAAGQETLPPRDHFHQPDALGGHGEHEPAASRQRHRLPRERIFRPRGSALLQESRREGDGHL